MIVYLLLYGSILLDGLLGVFFRNISTEKSEAANDKMNHS